MNWNELETKLNEWLRDKAIECGLIYRKRVIRDLSSKVIFVSDGMFTDGRVLIVLEIERSQPHPDTNVGKYWFLYEKYYKYNRIVLIHIFTSKFTSRFSHIKLGDFYIEKMKEIMFL